MENEILDNTQIKTSTIDPNLRKKFNMVAIQILLNCILHFTLAIAFIAEIYVSKVGNLIKYELLIQAVLFAAFGIILYRTWLSLLSWLKTDSDAELEKHSNQLAMFFMVNTIMIFVVIFISILRYLFS